MFGNAARLHSDCEPSDHPPDLAILTSTLRLPAGSELPLRPGFSCSPGGREPNACVAGTDARRRVAEPHVSTLINSQSAAAQSPSGLNTRTGTAVRMHSFLRQQLPRAV